MDFSEPVSDKTITRNKMSAYFPNVFPIVAVGASAGGLKAQTDQDLSGYKTATLNRRIARRMAICQPACAKDYLTMLNREQPEADALTRDFLIGETHLFRDSDAFTDLDELVIRPLLASRSVDGPFRVWVPGCEA